MFLKIVKAVLLQTLILTDLKLLLIGIDPEKTAPVLNHIAENEGTQCHRYRSLKGLPGRSLKQNKRLTDQAEIFRSDY